MNIIHKTTGIAFGAGLLIGAALMLAIIAGGTR